MFQNQQLYNTHILHNYTSQIDFPCLTNWTIFKIIIVLFTFSVSQQSLTKYNFFLKVQNCHLVSLIVLVPQWMLKWSKRVSLRSVSSTNYPTSHHPQLSIFFFTCLQILCITKHYNIQRVQNQIHTTFTDLSFLAYKTQKWSKIH